MAYSKSYNLKRDLACMLKSTLQCVKQKGLTKHNNWCQLKIMQRAKYVVIMIRVR